MTALASPRHLRPLAPGEWALYDGDSISWYTIRRIETAGLFVGSARLPFGEWPEHREFVGTTLIGVAEAVAAHTAAERGEHDAESRAEIEAELGYERWLEDAGERLDPAGYAREAADYAREGVAR